MHTLCQNDIDYKMLKQKFKYDVNVNVAHGGGMCSDECRLVIINVTMLMTVFLVGTKDGEL